jgi:hypothetical protein
MQERFEFGSDLKHVLAEGANSEGASELGVAHVRRALEGERVPREDSEDTMGALRFSDGLRAAMVVAQISADERGTRCARERLARRDSADGVACYAVATTAKRAFERAACRAGSDPVGLAFGEAASACALCPAPASVSARQSPGNVHS